MATYEELMAALRKADAAGDVDAAKVLARQAAAARGIGLSTPPVTAPVQDQPTPSLPADPQGPSGFTEQIAALMGPPVQQTAVGPRVVAPAMPAQVPGWIEQATTQPAPVQAAPAQPVDPLAAIVSSMAGPSVPQVAANLDQFFPGSGYTDVMRGGPRMPPQVVTQPAQPADPFAGESLGDLAARRGQQFAMGAAEVGASVPEALAIMGADADAGRVQGADQFAAQNAATIADITARLQDPTLDPDTRAFLQQNLADLGAGVEVAQGMAAEPVIPAQDRPLFKAGDTARKAVEGFVGKPDPRDTGFWSQVAQGAGNMTGMIAASVAGGVAGGPVGALATGAASGSALNAPSLYKEAIEAGADEETAQQAARWGALIGASEIVPITRALKILPPRLRGELTTGMMRKFVDIAQSAGEEAAQEYLATVANNITAQQLFDPERGWTEGATDAALVGAVLGGGVGAVGSALEGRGATRPPREREDQGQLPASQPPAPPMDQIAAAMQPPAPEQAPTVPQPAQPGPQTQQPTDPLAQITAAMTGRPAPQSGQNGQNGQTITRAEAEADPNRFEIVDEAEGQGANWRPTGAQVVIDKTTGQAIPLAPDTAAASAPVAAGAPGGESAGQPQAAPVQGSGDVPAVAGAAPEADVVAASGGVTPPAPVPNQPRNFEFVDAAGVQNIQTEPDVMQYKAGGDAEGVTDRLRGVTEWRPERAGMSIIYEYADGRRVIADGHQRLGLAKRLAGQGKAIQLPAMILRQVDGVTPEEARVTAALKNIAEGSGTALDAAKVLRGTDKTPAQLDLPPNSAIVRDATGMRNLSDQAFGMVVNGVASERDGGIVGRVVTDKAAQANILGLLARMQKDRPISAFVAEQVAKDAAADTVTETQDSLFGPEMDTKNLYLERAKILEAANRMARDEKRAFKNVLDNADRLQAAGNQLDADGNKARVDNATTISDYLGREANTKGAISEALTAAARALNGGATLAGATRQFLDAVERELGARGGERPSGDQGGATSVPERQPEPEPQAVDPDARDDNAADGDLFGGPVAAPTPDPQADILAAMTGQAAKPPADDLFGATPQTSKTPEQIRAEAEAKVRADQSKLRKPGGNDGDAGPLFGAQGDLLGGEAQLPQGEKPPTADDFPDLNYEATGGQFGRKRTYPGYVIAKTPQGTFTATREAGPGREAMIAASAPTIEGLRKLMPQFRNPFTGEPFARPADTGADPAKRADRFPTTLEAIASGPKGAGRLTHIYAEYRGKRYYLASVPGNPEGPMNEWLRTFPAARILSTDRADLTSINGEVPELEAAIAERAGTDTPESMATTVADLERRKAALLAPYEAEAAKHKGVKLGKVSPAAYKRLMQAVAAAETIEGRYRAADAWVQTEGIAQDREHMVLFSRDGVPISVTMGLEGTAGGTYSVAPSMVSMFYAEMKGVGYATHNHPVSSSFSPGDYVSIAAGYGSVTAIGHNGSFHLAKAGENMPELPFLARRPGDSEKAQRLQRAINEVDHLVANRVTNDYYVSVGKDEPKARIAARAVLSLFLHRVGVIKYSGDAARVLADLGIDADAAFQQHSNDVVAAFRRHGFPVAEVGNPIGDRPSDWTGGAARVGSGQSGTVENTDANAGPRPSVKPPSTGNADIDGALDDLFGDDNDVPSTGTDLERPGRDGDAADDMGAGDVPASARPSGRGTRRGGRKAASGNGKRSAASGIPDGDAPAVGSGGNPGADGSTGADSQPAASGNGGSGDGGRGGRLSSDTGGKADAAGNASGSTGKLTPAQQLAAIRNIMKEDVLDFVAGPDRRGTDSDAFRRWFGDSKVVGPDGRPMVVYHGSGWTDIESFMPNWRDGDEKSQQTLDWFRGKTARGDQIGLMNFRAGTFFSPQPDYANNYTAEERGVMYPVYIKAENPVYKDMVTGQTTPRPFPDRSPDALILTEGGKINEIAVIDPTQIKSIFNQGTWDAASPYMLREDPANPIDPRKAEALESIFVGALEGVDPAKFTDRQIFASIILPLRDAGMTRAEIADLTPYLEAFLADLRAGRVNLDPDADLIAPSREIESEDRAEKQAAADKIKVKAVDRANIDATLPLLLPEQRDDVFKVETRFAKPDGHGMLITNGTGTGKTFSGGGVIKRFVQQGKTNVLIIAPSDAVIAGWTRALEALAVPVSQLRNTKDAGRGVVITTYANLRANNMLASRDWDLVVTDESQNLLSNATGDATSYLKNLRAITKRPNDFWHLVRMRHADEIAKLWPESEAKNMRRASDAVEAARRALDDKMRAETQAMHKNPPPRSKVLFLSATPFAYDKTVDYVEGYLFNYPEDGTINGSNQSGRNLFMVSNFGYRIRSHKLTKPEHAVDSAVFERDFHEKLKREGVLSGRSLQVDVDYDRRFVKKDDADGTRLDEALEVLDELAAKEREAQAAVTKAGQIGTRLPEPFGALQNHMRKNFDYLARQQLLEAIKARLAVDEIKAHIALGRKVVVFHDFNVGGGLNPFTHLKTQVVGIDEATGEEIREAVSPMTPEAMDGYRKLLEAHPWIADLNFKGYKPPVQHLPEALGKTVRLFNGKVPTKQRLANLAAFNTDGSGVDVLVVQADAGGAGISMHDITKGHQRALINLGMPTKPTTTLQQEGRILRVGSQSDAIFRYFTIGTGWERTAFAQRIAERSGTVENLALGNDARDMMNAFIDAYMDAADFAPSAEDGKGGKSKDQRSHNITPYQRAVSHYFGRPKISGRRDQRDGVDFYPTAEPLAFKMVEWAGIRANERVLEPSAGDGAIVRYMPDDAALTFVEPSADLRSTAQLRAPKGDAKETTFEQHHISNKYHAIVMNPPFGSGGSTAIQHLAKAAKHLRAGGRIVALIPTGPSADKKFATWWESDDAKGLNLSAEVQLPAVAFERAGTGVMTRVVIIDKPAEGQVIPMGQQNLNFTGATTIQQFFDRLESYEVRRRPDPVQDVIEELEAEGQDATTPADTRRPGPPLATEIGTFEKTTVTSKKGKVFPAAHHAAKVERDVYDQMKAAATALDGWWHRNDAAPKGSGPTFAFRTEAARDAFLADMQKPTALGGMEETAYHGTPHDFDRFSLDAIGTGEGAQVYGWGLYFAGRRAVSEWYRKTLAKRKILLDGEEVPETMRTSYLSAAASADWDAFAAKHQFDLSQDDIAFEVSPSEWRDAKALYPISLKSMFLHIRGDIEGGGWALADRLEQARQDELAKVARVSHLPHYLSEAVARLAAIKTFKAAASESGTGRLFTVDIPGPENLMDWDAQLADQPEAVTRAMRELMPDLFGGKGESVWTEEPETAATHRAWRDQFGWQIIDLSKVYAGGYFNVVSPSGTSIAEKRKLADAKDAAMSARKHFSKEMRGREAYGILSAERGGDRAASEALRAAGIPGHRYLDGSSRSAGEGSHNYVIYDDAAIQIIAKEQRAQLVREAAATTEEVTRLMPKLRAELDRLDLKRVKLSRVEDGNGWQGAFVVTGDGEMEIIIGASLDPVKTLHHEVIHALRAMDLFTPEEWKALSLAAERKWLAKHDIAVRYPHLTEAERIEEAIAEEFSEALAAKQAPKGSILIRAFNKIARVFRAFRNVMNGAGYQTPQDIFGRVLAGEVSARQAGNTGAQVSFQRKGRDTDTGDLFAQPEPAKPSGMTADQRRELEARQRQSKMRKTGGNSGDAGPLFNDDRDLFGQRTMFQRPPLAVRPLTPQARAHRNSAMGATPFIPDRRVWESLTRAGIPIWQRLRDLPGAASDAVDRARYVIQDRMLPFLRAQEAVMKQTGRPLPKEHDAYLQETTFSGKVGRHLLEIDEEYTKPIIQIIAKSQGKITADSVGEWLYARHAIERNAYIASINPNMPDGGSGMESIDAAQILADVAASPEAAQYDQIGAMIDALRERNLKLREDAGLISNADANLWRTQYKHYVPLKGFEETDHYESMMDLGGVRTGRRFSIRGQETRRALGRQSEAFNPLQSAITQAQEVAIRSEKNRVAQAMYALAESYPSKALWEVKRPKQKRYFNRTTGLVEMRVENPVTMVLEPNEMAVKIDGKEHRILFNDQRLAESAGTLGADQMGAALRVLSMFSRFFSMTRTMLNPEFMITNAFRDFQTAQFNIQAFGEGDKARIAKAMAKNWRKAFLGAMRGSTYRFDTEWSRYYKEFQKAGAQVWFWTMEQPEAARGDLEKRIELARGTKAQRALKVMTTPSAFFSFRDNAALNFIERTNLAVDNAIRLAAFVEARRAGWDVEKAAFLAKELTVNFNRRGEAGAQMNALYPFFNAAIQGTVRTVKAISSRRVALMVLTAFAAGALNDMLNAALSDEDEDGELFYDKVADFRNERNFHLVLWGTGDNPFSIPMPYGYNVFPYAGQQLGKVMRGVKDPDEAFADVARAAFGAFSPISAATPAQMISPVLSDPIVEMAENKNWLGIPIYPQDYGNQTEPDAYVHFRGATAVSKWVAQTINSLTGGDMREPGMVDVSPETLDHLANFVTGSAGAFWGRSFDMVAKSLQGDFESIEQRSIPFVRNLTSPVGDWSDRDRFYRFSAEVKNAQADKKAYEAAGMPVPKKTSDLAALYPAYLAANREMSGKGEWNASKAGSLAAREQNKVWLDFNGKYLRVMGKQGE